jgi:hypothetical protein
MSTFVLPMHAPLLGDSPVHKKIAFPPHHRGFPCNHLPLAFPNSSASPHTKKKPEYYYYTILPLLRETWDRRPFQRPWHKKKNPNTTTTLYYYYSVRPWNMRPWHKKPEYYYYTILLLLRATVKHDRETSTTTTTTTTPCGLVPWMKNALDSSL